MVVFASDYKLVDLDLLWSRTVFFFFFFFSWWARHNWCFFSQKYFYLFLAVLGLRCCVGVSLVAVKPLAPLHCGTQAFHCWGFCGMAWAVGHMDFTGSIAGIHRPSCFTACGIFLVQGSNPCLLHWQANSLPLSHQGSPNWCFLCPRHIEDTRRYISIFHSSADDLGCFHVFLYCIHVFLGYYK